MNGLKGTLLVTGASGLVGGHVVMLAGTEWSVHAAYLSHAVSHTDIQTHRFDLASESGITHLIEKIQPDAVIHAAALSNIDYCEENPEEAFHINATATGVLAELSVQYGFRLVYVSTDMVFNGEQGNYREKDKTGPINVYGNSKLMGERFIQAVGENYVIARSALVYGRPLGHSSSFSEGVSQRLAEGESVQLFTDQYRTPILVQDLAGALIELASNEFQGIMHLGGETKVDRYTFGKRLAEINGYDSALLEPVLMDSVPLAADRPVDASLNTEKAAEVLATKLQGYYDGLERVDELMG